MAGARPRKLLHLRYEMVTEGSRTVAISLGYFHTVHPRSTHPAEVVEGRLPSRALHQLKYTTPLAGVQQKGLGVDCSEDLAA